jgi:hypothetical protein
MYKLVLSLVFSISLGIFLPGGSAQHGNYGGAYAATTLSSSSQTHISSWVSCNGESDDSQGAARAFAAARHGAFKLIVDCPVRLKIGDDIDRPIFIDTGTTVEFTGSGKFIVDNIFQPAFVIANSNNITLTNWKVEWYASLPVNDVVNSYMQNGEVVKSKSVLNAGNIFNDERLTSWISANRGVAFNRSHGNVNSIWAGSTNTCAVFFIVGSSTNFNVTGMHVYAPPAAGGDQFIPTVFSFNSGYKSNQTVTAQTTLTSAHVAVPHAMYFSDVVLDGTYMGWVGDVQDAIFENITSHRYGDLQDANGGHVGGIGKWFAPPHLFYLNYVTDGDPALFNTNIQIKNVVDDGPRVGVARDKGGSDSTSGYALSLKIGCIDCVVDTYKSSRPDGFLDVLPSNNLTISNANATYNSVFLNNLYPGWRFPKSGYENLTFENISLTDLGSYTVLAPIGSATQESNENIKLTNVHVRMNRFIGQPKASISNFYGHGNTVALEYAYAVDSSRLSSMQKEPVSVTLSATPDTIKVGVPAKLTWTTRDATSCSGGGNWSGGLAPNGSRTVKLTKAGVYDYTVTCRNSSNSSSTTLTVVATN